jgi:phage antirepressor YoqD-like protein
MILRVDRDGVEFFVNTITGLTGISISGLARLCGISQQALSKLLLRLEVLIARRQKATTKNTSESLESNPSNTQEATTKNTQKATTKIPKNR